VAGISKGEIARPIEIPRGTGINIGLLVNFGRSVEVKRRVFDQ